MVGFAPGINQTNQPKKLNSKRVVKHTALSKRIENFLCDRRRVTTAFWISLVWVAFAF
jgi:hypothetical protein